ncbi:dihydropteroate synthase [Streptomyces mirabilis]|uniref:dihydropteroate synthase n=1 Tax=Streptomyces mirabilis TaxID=68239 RepID=UPI0036C1EF69
MTATAHVTTPPHPGTPELHPHGLPRSGRTLVMGVVNVTPDSFSDGGLSFAPEAAVAHGLALFGRLGDVVALGRPVLVRASRKSFLGRLLADPATGQPRPARLRDAATTAVSVLAAAQGAWCLRVHDVASTLDAVRVTARWGAEAAASVRSLGSFEAQPG